LCMSCLRPFAFTIPIASPCSVLFQGFGWW
jgi:hypothetical protein